jgi:hypothetical protein
VNGKKEGFGTYVFKNNDTYTGYWDNDNMHSMGIYQYNNNITNNYINITNNYIDNTKKTNNI